MSLILSGTDGLSDVDGTVSTPAIRGTDSNTGIFFPAADTIAFAEGGAESMRIDSSGNLGIGTASPACRLDLNRGSAGLLANFTDGVNTNFQIETASLLATIGPSAGSTAMAFKTGNTERMRIDASGNTTFAGSVLGTSETFQVGVNSSGKDTRFGVLSGGNGRVEFYSAGSERMRIDTSGNLLVGTTATQSISGISTDHTFIGTTNTNRWVSGFINNSASSPYGLAVSYTGSAPNASGNQFLFCRDTGGTRFEVRSNGGIANYSGNNVNLSDAREKTNIELASNYLNKICAIPIKTFNYIDQNTKQDDGLTLGVIAQDVQAVAPELVMESNWAAKNEPEKMRLSIYQTDLQYALMKCIQEQQALIENLTTRLNALEGN